MSTSEIIAAIFALLSIVGGLIGKHIIDELRERVRNLEAANNSAVLLARLAANDKDLDAIWDQIGRSGEEGMRKSVHFSEGTTRVLSAHAQAIDKALERLERKVFNGHREHE